MRDVDALVFINECGNLVHDNQQRVCADTLCLETDTEICKFVLELMHTSLLPIGMHNINH